jgi:hypothetical protein
MQTHIQRLCDGTWYTITTWSMAQSTKHDQGWILGRDHMQGWPELYVHTVYDSVFGQVSVESTENTPYKYSSDQLYMTHNY